MLGSEAEGRYGSRVVTWPGVRLVRHSDSDSSAEEEEGGWEDGRGGSLCGQMAVASHRPNQQPLPPSCPGNEGKRTSQDLLNEPSSGGKSRQSTGWCPTQPPPR